MSAYDEIQISEWLRDGIAAAKSDRLDEARELLMRVVESNERSEQGWLWLSSVVETDEDRLICLENALTLNSDNAQARAGLKWLRQRGAGDASPTSDGQSTEISAPPGPQAQLEREPAATGRKPELFLTPEGCVYCGLAVADSDARCPNCAKRLTTKRFKKEERSYLGYVLHAHWVLLVGINLADFFLIGFLWHNVDKVSPLIKDYLPFFAGSAVIGSTTMEALVEPELWTQLARLTLLGLAILGGIDAVGLFLRRPLAHTLGTLLIALHLLIGVSLFVLGFLGYLMAAFRGVLTVLLTKFMFSTVEDFSKVEHRERLEPDRHLLNDADYYTRGRVYEKRGMWAKALLHWRRAAAMNPDHDTYFAATARAFAHLGRYEQALAQIDEAVRVSRTPEEWQRLREIIVEARGGRS